MSNRQIKLDLKFNAGDFKAGIKQVSDELKKFSSAAARDGQILANAFKAPNTEVKNLSKSFDFLENSIKRANSAFASLKPPSWLSSGGFGSSQSIQRVKDSVLNNYLKNTGGLPEGGLLAAYPKTGTFKIPQTSSSIINKEADSAILKERLADIKAAEDFQIKLYRMNADAATRVSTGFNGAKNSINEASGALSKFNGAMTGILAGVAAGVTNQLIAQFNLLGDRIIEFGKQSMQTSMTFDAIKNKFKAAAGGVEEGARSFDYVKTLANDMGLDLVQAADSFALFEASALRSGLSMSQTQKIYADVSAAIVSLQLDSQRTGLVFRAFEQIASKETVQMEELKLQLGDHLPGALAIAARSMGVSSSAFRKMVEEGKVLADEFLPKYAEQIRKELGGSSAEAAQMARAHFNRFNNAMIELKDSIGDLINAGLIPLVKYFTPIIKNIADSITYYHNLEKITGELTNAIKAFGLALGTTGVVTSLILFSNQIKLATVTLGAFFVLARNVSVLTTLTTVFSIAAAGVRAFTAALLVNPYFLAITGITALTVATKTYLDYKGREIKAAQDNVRAASDEKSALEESKSVAYGLAEEYDELSKKKNKTAEETKRLLDIQIDLNKLLPSFTDSFSKHGTAVKAVGEVYKEAAADVLKAEKAMISMQQQLLLVKYGEEVYDSEAPRLGIPDESRITDQKTKNKIIEMRKNEAKLKLLDLQLEDLYSGGLGSSKKSKTEDDENQKAIRERKKAFDDEIKDLEQTLALKLAKETLAEEKILELKESVEKEKQKIAAKYVLMEKNKFAKKDYEQAQTQAYINELETRKQLKENQNNFELKKEEELARQKLAGFFKTEEEKIQATLNAERKKLALLESFKNPNNQAEILAQKTKIVELKSAEKEAKITAGKELLDIYLKNEDQKKDLVLATTYKTNKEILDLEIKSIGNKINLLKDYLKDKSNMTLKQERELNEQIEDLNIERERKEKERREKYSGKNEYGGKYGTDFKSTVQDVIDSLPSKTQWQKFWKDLANAFADAMSSLEQKIGGSLSDNIEAFLNKTKTAGEVLKDFFRDLDQFVKRMVAEVIAEMIKLYVIRPILEAIFRGIFGGGKKGPTEGGNLFTAALGAFGGFFADGGSPPIGIPSIVGERGPELFIPNTRGTIISNKELGNLGGSTKNYVYAPQISTGATPEDVFRVLDTHSKQFFAKIQLGIEEDHGLRAAVRGA